MVTHAAFAFDVAAALVLWVWKILVSFAAASITVLIQGTEFLVRYACGGS